MVIGDLVNDSQVDQLPITNCPLDAPSAAGLSTSRTSSTPACGSTLDDGVRLFETPDLLAVGCARQPGAREAARRPHLLQLQHPPRSDQRLRRELPVLLVRAAEAGRSGRVHDVARGGVGQAAAARPTSRSPRSTSSTACIPICRSTTTRRCCGASSGSVRASI